MADILLLKGTKIEIAPQNATVVKCVHLHCVCKSSLSQERGQIIKERKKKTKNDSTADFTNPTVGRLSRPHVRMQIKIHTL